MSSSFLRDFYRRYYGKEMRQRALCLLDRTPEETVQ